MEIVQLGSRRPYCGHRHVVYDYQQVQKQIEFPHLCGNQSLPLIVLEANCTGRLALCWRWSSAGHGFTGPILTLPTSPVALESVTPFFFFFFLPESCLHDAPVFVV